MSDAFRDPADAAPLLEQARVLATAYASAAASRGVGARLDREAAADA